jgi:hypothetical protein
MKLRNFAGGKRGMKSLLAGDGRQAGRLRQRAPRPGRRRQARPRNNFGTSNRQNQHPHPESSGAQIHRRQCWDS